MVKIFHVNFLGYAHWFMSIIISQSKDHSISVEQARYATSIVAKYLDTATVKARTKFNKITLPANMIFTKGVVSTKDENVEKLNREYNIHYRSCIGLLIYLLSTRVDLSLAVHKLANFSANRGKVHFEGLIHLLRYIRHNKTLGLKYHADLNYAPVTDLLKQASIKTKNHLMDFLILVGRIVHTMEEVKEHILFSIKVVQLTMSHMFQDQFLNPVQKLSTMKHALQEWLQHISEC